MFGQTSKAEWLTKNGFSKEGVTYIVAGGNTFNVKDILKSHNCTYSKLLNWHCAEKFELDGELEGFIFVPIFFDDVYVWREESGFAHEKEEAPALIKEALQPYRKNEGWSLPSTMKDSVWIGEVGERLRKIPAKIVGKKEINSNYGLSTLYTFESGNSVLCWFTSSYKDVEIGDSILLSGTIKSLNDYKGQKQTMLSRCLLYPIE